MYDMIDMYSHQQYKSHLGRGPELRERCAKTKRSKKCLCFSCHVVRLILIVRLTHFDGAHQ
jgi:hypothetical protein